MNKVRQALIYASISSYVTKILALISIARILTPTELGVYAIAGALVLIAGELKTFGAGGYLIRQKQIDKAIVKSALGITMAICWVIGILLIVSASSIESFYGIDDISALIHILSISFFATPFIAISVSLMKRDFQFKKLCVIEIPPQVIMIICTVALVYFDFSYFAIAIANAVSSLVQLLLIVVIKHPEMCWFPQWISRLEFW